MRISEAERLREEDPYTGPWTEVADSRVVVARSRFGVDLNRPRNTAVYIRPGDAWGLKVWKRKPPKEIVEASRGEYDAFYRQLAETFEAFSRTHGRFVVFDLHTYNHRREGPDAPPADPEENPEVNVGTGTMDRDRWAGIVDRFMADLRSFDFGGRALDVRENVKFRGGYMAKWSHENFPLNACVIAIEFKKFFMDEWTGELFLEEHARVGQALRSTVGGVLEELERSGRGR
jgi:N-formylglutamate amidohydrolase